MTTFTLQAALKILKKNIAFSAIIFFSSYYIISTSSFIDERFELKQTLVTQGQLLDGVEEFNFLTKSEVLSILDSNTFRRLVLKKINKDADINFFIDKSQDSKGSNITFKLKGSSSLAIVQAAITIQQLLKESELEVLSRYINFLDTKIDEKLKTIKVFSDEIKLKKISINDINEYAEMQNILNKAHGFDMSNSIVSNNNIASIIKIYNDKKIKNYKNKREVIILESEIALLKEKRKNAKGISYLLLSSPKDVEKYFPNEFLYIGVALLSVVIFNLLILIFYLRRF